METNPLTKCFSWLIYVYVQKISKTHHNFAADNSQRDCHRHRGQYEFDSGARYQPGIQAIIRSQPRHRTKYVCFGVEGKRNDLVFVVQWIM